jgi:hypothetical protein
MASLLLAAGEPGERACLPNARIMVHQPIGGAQVRCDSHRGPIIAVALMICYLVEIDNDTVCRRSTVAELTLHSGLQPSFHIQKMLVTDAPGCCRRAMRCHLGTGSVTGLWHPSSSCEHC